MKQPTSKNPHARIELSAMIDLIPAMMSGWQAGSDILCLKELRLCGPT